MWKTESTDIGKKRHFTEKSQKEFFIQEKLLTHFQFMKMDNLLDTPKGKCHFYTFFSYLLLVGFWEQNFLYFHEEKPSKDQSV